MALSVFLLSMLLPPTLAFIFHIGLARLLPRHKITAAIMASALGVAATLLGLAPYSAASAALALIGAMAMLSVHPYFNYFLLSETARRIHVLRCLRQGKPIDDYSGEVVLEVRLQRLQSAGAARCQRGIWSARPSILMRLCVAIQFLERLIFPSRFTRPRNHPSASPLKGADECGR